MRNFLTLFILMFLMAACGNGHGSDTYSLWSPTDEEFDDAVRSIELGYANDESNDTLRSLTFRLAELAEQDSDNNIKAARAAFFKARFYEYTEPYTEAWKSEAQNEIDKAYKAYGNDTASYPYDMFRLRYIQNKLRPRSLENKYYDNVRALKEAKEFGDSLTEAGALNNIGLVHLNLGDSMTAISYFDRSRMIFHNLGHESWEKKILFSVAQANIKVDPLLHDSLMRDLHHFAANKRDTVLLTIVLHNLYSSHQDIKYIIEALSLVKGRPGFQNTEAFYKNIIASSLLRAGEFPDSAAALARSSMQLMTPHMLPEYALAIYSNYTTLLEQEGKLDSALLYMHRMIALQDSISRRNSLNQVYKNIAQHKINESRNEAIREQWYERTLYAGITIALIFMALAIIAILLRRHSNLRLEKIKSDLELTRNQLQLASSLVVVKENENAIDTTVKTISKLMDEGRILYADGQRVCSALKAHLNHHDELETFQKVYADIHPEFTRRLFEISSNLSENQVRLAKYIAMGMDNRQISRVMRIEYKSLITARYRLRLKLGLNKEDSLEALLYRLAEVRTQEPQHD